MFYSAKSIKSAKKHSYTEEEKNKKIIKIYIQIFYRNNHSGKEIEITSVFSTKISKLSRLSLLF